MKQFLIFLSVSLSIFWTTSAGAQQASWIQVEAQPSLREGQERARAYTGAFENVNGFALGSGWYIIAVGPFSEDAAKQRLRQLRSENLVPRDSYVTDGNNFKQQFWPVGATALSAQPLITGPEITLNIPEVAEPAVDVAIVVPVEPAEEPEETLREARRSETLLNKQQRKDLQVALEWEGFYNAAIDGSYGRGTRAAMSAYQQSLGYDATGVLTTRQRQELLDSYNAILAGLNLQPIIDNAAQIEMQMPKAMVKFDRYEPPFVHYSAIGDSKAKVLLISQEGDQSTLYGLYDIMQTLEIVPLSGKRDRKKNSFVLTGQNQDINSYTYAAHKDGMIKGFTLVWPAGDQKRLDRVIAAMQSSFEPFGDSALSELLGDGNGAQSIDLLAGLNIRRPDFSRSGFYVDQRGSVLTTSEAVQTCQKVTLDGEIEAEVVYADAKTGMALLKPQNALAPIAYAEFNRKSPRLQSDVAVSGYSYEGVLGAPTLTYGKMAEAQDLDGNTERQRLALAPFPGDAGGPVFDAGGGVVGMLLPRVESGERKLPNNVSFATNTDAISALLSQQGVTISSIGVTGVMAPEDLTLLAADMTVLVSCWN